MVRFNSIAAFKAGARLARTGVGGKPLVETWIRDNGLNRHLAARVREGFKAERSLRRMMGFGPLGGRR